MKEELGIIYLPVRRGLKWVRGHGRWFWLMGGRGLRGRLVSNGNQKPWVSIKPPVPLLRYRFIGLVTPAGCVAQVISCYSIKHAYSHASETLVSSDCPSYFGRWSRRSGTEGRARIPRHGREERVSKRAAVVELFTPASESPRERLMKCQEFRSPFHSRRNRCASYIAVIFYGRYYVGEMSSCSRNEESHDLWCTCDFIVCACVCGRGGGWKVEVGP